MAEIICIGRGTATLGRYTRHEDGTTTQDIGAHWEPDAGGGSVAIFKMDADTNKVTCPAEVFGDWQAAEYLGRVLELLGPGRAPNLPHLREIVYHMSNDGLDICDYCGGLLCCAECIVKDWKQESEEE